jgi:hypothetical protein
MGLCIFWKFLVGFWALFEVNHEILCIFGRPSWDFAHIWKFLVGFCALLQVPHIMLRIFGSSSWDFVHFWNFLMAKDTRVHLILSLFSLQNTCFCNMHTDWLRLSLAATSSKRHPVITNIRLTRPRLMQRRWIVTFVWRRCTSLELSQIIFMIWYDFSYIFYFKNFYCKQAMVRVNYWW